MEPGWFICGKNKTFENWKNALNAFAWWNNNGTFYKHMFSRIMFEGEVCYWIVRNEQIWTFLKNCCWIMFTRKHRSFEMFNWKRKKLIHHNFSLKSSWWDQALTGCWTIQPLSWGKMFNNLNNYLADTFLKLKLLSIFNLYASINFFYQLFLFLWLIDLIFWLLMVFSFYKIKWTLFNWIIDYYFKI